ncbi:GTPase Era [Govanella unica]|uniref:GTPase Era n=1 Tax=Govanella unica TaxID=2975056 RepID=A0A9X3Z7R6_9PROT|nr:GTPase Era [Govania unica]MDA5194269.1 GTPase Era [Govania unica]
MTDPASGDMMRCGFVAIVGAPNAGKSTLLNRLSGSKLAIVSAKVQTTRTRTLGIVIEGRSQIVFVDTPGIFKPRRRLDRAMVAAAWEGAEDADQIVLMVDAARKIDEDTRRIIEQFKAANRKVILALNKIDGLHREKLLGLAAELNESGVFSDVFMISALTGDGVDDLLAHVSARLPEGPWHYPEDQLTDITERVLAAEITREKLYGVLHDELPYAATVETESWEEKKDGSVRIAQVIFIERESQKAIVIGKSGQQLKKIGQRAREDLEGILERRVHLFIFVKVRENWGDDRERYRNLGLDYVE